MKVPKNVKKRLAEFEREIEQIADQTVRPEKLNVNMTGDQLAKLANHVRNEIEAGRMKPSSPPVTPNFGRKGRSRR